MANGFNLIGISLYRDIQLSEIRFNGLTYNDAVAQGKVVSINSTIDLNLKGNKPLILQKGNAYWLQTTESGILTMPTVNPNIETYKLTDLMFRNGSGVEKNISDAWAAGWIAGSGVNNIVWYYDSIAGVYKNVYSSSPLPSVRKTLNSWEGLFVLSNKPNITMLRQNGETIKVLNEGWNGFALNDNSTVSSTTTCEKQKDNKHTKINQGIIIGTKGGKTEDIKTYFQDNIVIKLPTIRLN
jgi:hypothetical protein